ncbi:MAG: transposase family protein [Planctomycetes bacterium]|nr:transposase family protein [Planctomycetota bacterium]
MSPFSLLSQLIGNHLSPTDLVVTPKLVAIALAPTTGNAFCPLCGRSSDRVHGRYRRVLADLPICGRQLVLILRLRKFLCVYAGCPRRIFCERIPGVAAPHARSTARLSHHHRALGLALGGEPASRLAEKMSTPASGDTILRRVKNVTTQPEPRYRFVGIDDFALRKGQTYGTVLVDLERHRVIDLFDGRDGSPVLAWLSSHRRRTPPSRSSRATGGRRTPTPARPGHRLHCKLPTDSTSSATSVNSSNASSSRRHRHSMLLCNHLHPSRRRKSRSRHLLELQAHRTRLRQHKPPARST